MNDTDIELPTVSKIIDSIDFLKCEEDGSLIAIFNRVEFEQSEYSKLVEQVFEFYIRIYCKYINGHIIKSCISDTQLVITILNENKIIQESVQNYILRYKGTKKSSLWRFKNLLNEKIYSNEELCINAISKILTTNLIKNFIKFESFKNASEYADSIKESGNKLLQILPVLIQFKDELSKQFSISE